MAEDQTGRPGVTSVSGVSDLPANIKVVVQEDPFVAALIADVGQARTLTSEQVAE